MPARGRAAEGFLALVVDILLAHMPAPNALILPSPPNYNCLNVAVSEVTPLPTNRQILHFSAVFLERQFADLRMKESEDKMVDILRKTWSKMGPKGRAAALALAPSLCKEEQA